MNHTLGFHFPGGTAHLLSGMLIGLAAHGLHGQAVVTFDDADATWLVARTFPQGSIQDPDFAGTTTSTYFYDGDTLIDGSLWQRMHALPTWGNAQEPHYLGATRQAGNIVLFSDTLGNVDTLYNFALEVGDTMRFGVPGSDFMDSLRVDSIGQILIQGVAHKVFHFSLSTVYFTLESYLSDTWIEGIGSIHGPLAPRSMGDLEDWYPFTFPDSTRLTCYAQDQTVLWQHGGYPACITNIQLATNELDHAPLRAYPNPSNGYLSVESPLGGKFTISLRDVLGRVALHEDGSGPSQQLDLRALPCGPYLLMMQHATGIGYQARILLQ